MSEVKTFSPVYYGVIVTVGNLDARLICMVQEDPKSTSIHFLQVDTTLDDSKFKEAVFVHRNFTSELRGSSLAVKIIENSDSSVDNIIKDGVREAYGDQADCVVNKIDKPSILSLFAM